VARKNDVTMSVIGVRISMIGKSPMLMHNGQIADPMNEWAVKMGRITDKGAKKTDADMAELARLEWLGGLYVENGKIVMPTANIKKCLIEAAKVSRSGKDVSRSLISTSISVPLEYDGPKDIDKLFENKAFVDRSIVKVQGRVPRTRAIFRTWACASEWLLIESIFGFDDLERLANLAGLIEGINDRRIQGYGRFDAKVERIDVNV